MIQYYSPNLFFHDIIKLFFISNAKGKIINYYKNYTGKKYIVLTNSCRSALFLAYQSIGIKGEVITSPLTCKVAIDPIIESNNEPRYIDINPDTLNFDENLIEEAINKNTIAIQTIHFGGLSCDTSKIRAIADRNKLLMIEDCAQGFMASYNNIKTGSLADISCFSMIKNAYGIGGGVLATNDYTIYRKTLAFLSENSKNRILLSVYRIFRNLIETKRHLRFFNRLYNFILDYRPAKSEKKIADNIKSPNWLDLRVNWNQLRKAKRLNKLRSKNARLIINALRDSGLINNYKLLNYSESVFTKLYIVCDRFKSLSLIKELNFNSIEAKHLEQKYATFYQEKLVNNNELNNYNISHDTIISLPLTEQMKVKDINKMIDILKGQTL